MERMDELLTIWLARVVVILYTATLVFRCSSVRSSPTCRRMVYARWTWTVGCLMLALHELAALWVFHGGSQVAAWQHTARRTAEVTGLHWGGGLVINYAFAIFWMADVVWWWSRPDARARTGWWLALVDGLFLFMFFNAAFVFAPLQGRWLGGPALLIAGTCTGLDWWRRRRRATGASAVAAEPLFSSRGCC